MSLTQTHLNLTQININMEMSLTCIDWSICQRDCGSKKSDLVRQKEEAMKHFSQIFPEPSAQLKWVVGHRVESLVYMHLPHALSV